MSSSTQHQPTSFTNHDGRIGVQAGQYNVYGTSIVQQSQDPLSQLPNATDAPIYSSAKQHEPLCLSGTRNHLLDEIERWADSQDERCIFWLNGLAGTGKSTIARTVAHRYYYEKKRLAASFFFSRGGGEDVRGASKFVTSLAVQLAHNVEASKQFISDAIVKRDDIANHSLREQWHQLILGPLSKLSDSSCSTSLVLVVDALDECENEDNICVIVRLLAEAKSLAKVRLRVLLTSRPEASIRFEFSRLQEKHQLVLHDMPQSAVNQDIDLFLRHEFDCYRQEEEIDDDWPSSEVIDSLVQKASGLFIWAATAYRFICGGMDIDERLHMLLEGERHERSPEAHLDNIYITVLQASVQGDHSLQERQKYYTDLRAVLGSIVTLFSPLSVEALSKVLGFQKRYMNRMLKALHAILAIPTDNAQLLRLHHPSFRDFLLSEHRCSDANFVVDEKAAHRNLASKCLQLMSSSLQQGTCGIAAVGTLAAEKEETRFKPRLPSELQYACHYWIHHLIQGGGELLDGGEVHEFLQKHCLHWLEALGWMGKVREGIHAISSLVSITLVRLILFCMYGKLLTKVYANNCRELSEFVHDMKRFALYSRTAVEQAPLQVYCSALLFAPSGSIVKKQFVDRIPKWIKKSPQIDSGWNAVLQTLEGHSGFIYAVAFSPDSKILASASMDATVKLWDVGTGALLQTLKSDSNPISRILFSPTGKVLASVSNPQTINLWNVHTGELLRTFWGLPGGISEMAFSVDGKVLALILQYRRIELWNIMTGERSDVFQRSSNEVRAVTFLPDGTALMLVLDNMTVSVLNVRTSEVIRTIERHGEGIVALSSDCKILASVSTRETVELWDVTTGAILQRFREHTSGVSQLAFSSDGTVLVSASYDNTIKVWEVGTGELVQTFPDYAGFKEALALSPDNKALAYMSLGSRNTFKLWKTETAMLHTFKDHLQYLITLAFSPDGKVLASSSADSTVKLWDAGINAVGQTTRDGLGRVAAVAFSPNGKLLASISHDATLRDNALRLWDVVTGLERDTFEYSSHLPLEVSFSPDGKMLALVLANHDSDNHAIDIWMVGTDEVPQRLKGHSGRIFGATFSPDSKRLASVSMDNTVKLWDLNSGEALTLNGHSGWVRAVAFSPNGRILASVCSNGMVKLWDVERGELQYTLDGATSDFGKLAFSPDGEVLASITYEKIPNQYGPRVKDSWGEVVKLWATSTGDALQTLVSYSSKSSLFALWPKYEVRALGPSDGTIKLWDENWGEVAQTQPPDATLSSVSSSDDATFLSTHSGPISAEFSFSKSSPKQLGRPEIFISEQWIFYRGMRVLWLPPEYRVDCTAVYEGIVAIGHRNFGQVSLLEISDEP